MSIRRRIALLLSTVLLMGTLAMGNELLDVFRRSHSDLVESLMFEFATALATQVEKAGGVDAAKGQLESIFHSYKEKKDPKGLSREGINGFDIYVTDAKGIVVYASAHPEEVGQDYSRWNDVYLALRGNYGARSTRTNPKDPSTSVYFIASPVRIDGKITGVVSVIKAEQTVSPFVRQALIRFFPYAVLGALLVAAATALAMNWVTRPIHQLRDYALAVSEGKNDPPPRMGPKELAELLDAFEKMRAKLEGKKSIERFVQGLVHELKSPLTAIRGSAELSLEPLDEERRNRFLRNILEEGHRLQRILDELLRLAQLESQVSLSDGRPVTLAPLVRETFQAFEPLAEQKKLRFHFEGDETAEVTGEGPLVERAIRNLVLNAIQFSPQEGDIRVRVTKDGRRVLLTVSDQGAGVPDYARERIFDRFYSLERPDGGEKSSGLGLTFVKEVMKLHQGQVSLGDGPGSSFRLEFPGLP